MDYRCTSPSAERQHAVVPSRGFTLVELLVVIGIIALLLSIVLPTIGRARDAGTRVLCGNNLRQLAVAVRNYSMDNDGFIPFANDWAAANPTPWRAPGWLYYEVRITSASSWTQDQVKYGALWRYLNTYDVYHCPADVPPYMGTISGRNTHAFTSYLMNHAVTGFGAINFAQVPSLRLARMPADGVIFWEGDETKLGASDMWDDGTNQPNNGLTPRHGKGASVARFDGGTEWYTRDEFNQMAASSERNPLWCNPLKPKGHIND